MSSLLEKPLGELIAKGGAASTSNPVPDLVAVFVARIASLAFDVAQRAPKAAVMEAVASGSSAGVVGAFAELVKYETPATDHNLRSLLAGRVRLAEALEAAGGIWTADEAMQHCDVKRATLQLWRDKGRVLALQVADNSFVYPVAQFEPPSTDVSTPRPYEAIERIISTAGKHLTPAELIGILASPQVMLRDANGARTGFQAIADRDVDRVVAMIEHIVTPADEDAPRVGTTAV